MICADATMRSDPGRGSGRRIVQARGQASFERIMAVNVASSTHPQAQHHDMVWVEGGTFRMGSDRHYPEEAPVHRVTVDGFWIDRTPVTNRDFRKFVNETGYVTVAEIKPDTQDYPVRCRTCSRPVRWCSRHPSTRSICVAG